MTCDPVDLTARLVRCPSVTPAEGGAIALLQDLLSEAGFTCFRADRGGIANLVARWGPKGNSPTFGFNGHTDVVPVGDEAAWTHPPFGAEIADGWLYGRGATDMKSGVAAFVAAAIDLVREAPPENGAILITITGDEEADATDGTTAILDWMAEHGERMSACLVGEPTSPDTLGDAIKIDNGFIIPPEGPGLGFELDEDLARAHPYTGTDLHLEMQEEPCNYSDGNAFLGGAPPVEDDI